MNIYTHRTKFLTLPFFIIGATLASAQEIQPEDLNAQGGNDDLILVHDAVRPCVRVSDIERLVGLARIHPEGALLAVPVIDTLKRVHAQSVVETVDRSELWQAQTPQVFRFELLKRALLTTSAATDEASAVEALGIMPRICRGRADNLKITTSEDLAMARFILKGEPS